MGKAAQTLPRHRVGLEGVIGFLRCPQASSCNECRELEDERGQKKGCQLPQGPPILFRETILISYKCVLLLQDNAFSDSGLFL